MKWLKKFFSSRKLWTGVLTTVVCWLKPELREPALTVGGLIIGGIAVEDGAKKWGEKPPASE